MGKRIKTQRRGRGSMKFTAPSHHFKSEASYRNSSHGGQEPDLIEGIIERFIDDPARTTILAGVRWADGRSSEYIAAEGIAVGDTLEQGRNARVRIGNVLPLGVIPEGTAVFNIEMLPSDGGKFVRTSGGTALIVAKKEGKVIVKLPSRAVKLFNGRCLATIGLAAGGGRTEKPMVKAGVAFYAHKARGHRWPIVRGVAMNPVAHPHGGKEHHPGKATTVKRGAPPGQKVGHIAASRTGRRKRS